MDLYSIEKTKDYAFFRFISWYYQLTPNAIKLLKFILISLQLIGLFFLINLTKVKLTAFIYTVICLNIIFALISLETLIKNLAKGTGNEKMTEICNSIKESIDSFLNIFFSILWKIVLFLFSLYSGILFILKKTNQKEIQILFDDKIISLLYLTNFFFGCFITSFIIYFSLWINSVSIIRASAHSITCYNDYSRFTYKISGSLVIINTSTNIIWFGISFLFIYFLMYLCDNHYYIYPYDKIAMLLLPFLFGVCVVNLLFMISGEIFIKTVGNCLEFREKIDISLQSKDPKNPIYISYFITESVQSVISQVNNATLYLCGIIISLLITNFLKEKVDNQEVIQKFFVFPFFLQSLNIFIEIIRMFCVKTRPGLPKGGSDYQEVENIISVYSKKDLLLTGLEAILIFIIIFVFFSDAEKQTKLIMKREYFIINLFVCFMIGKIDYYLIKYFSKRYTEKDSPSVKYIVSMSLWGVKENIMAVFCNGIESGIFPFVLLCISFLGSYNLGTSLKLEYIQNEASQNLIGLFFISITLISLNTKMIFCDAVNNSKNFHFIINNIVKFTANELSFCQICKETLENVNEFQKNTKPLFTSVFFMTNFLFLKIVEQAYSDYTSHELLIKNDFFLPENYISNFLGVLVMKQLIALLVNSIIYSTQICITQLSQIFSTAVNTKNIVERTILDYRQSSGVITKISTKRALKIFFLVFFFLFMIFLSLKSYCYFSLKNKKLPIQFTTFFLFSSGAYSVVSSFSLNNNELCFKNANRANKEINKNTKLGKELGKIFDNLIERCICFCHFFIIFQLITFLPFMV